ncbi:MULTISPECIES: single-stranded DNA-binding protein [Dietzia]|uniref:Single-stranded DNA-binding protein n=2 Tax=Dietzia TaxID=37914 RepID=A0A177L7X5_9ACTN|nr:MULTISPECIES: single-stranded DNA-binding protein [Dietzia]EFV90935.1 single-stranded DNA-binding protein [Dietzia cinnamea P4]KZO58729.1 single-stranded DNA-binding protein [Dietzia maris]AWH93522.1 single-stranded DNA-binding protein [Dietzia lutea]MBB1022579.1 single-stranded DNA-binding protein [Dietzia sp. E1]MBM7231883.1 single-stranded DNA-binding protein [Dietzia cinnamea]
MAQGDTPITVVGNIVADPELRFTPSGAAVANFRIASTPRRFNSQTNQWEDGEGLFLTCNVWRQAAENVAESLQKGMRVIVNGRLRQRSYETREGEKRTVYEVEVDEVGPSLKYATAKVTRTNREGGGGGGFQGGGQQGGGFQGGGQQGGYGGGQSQGGYGGGQGRGQQNDDPWGSAPQAGGSGGFGGMDDEPPF